MVDPTVNCEKLLPWSEIGVLNYWILGLMEQSQTNATESWPIIHLSTNPRIRAIGADLSEHSRLMGGQFLKKGPSLLNILKMKFATSLPIQPFSARYTLKMGKNSSIFRQIEPRSHRVHPVHPVKMKTLLSSLRLNSIPAILPILSENLRVFVPLLFKTFQTSESQLEQIHGDPIFQLSHPFRTPYERSKLYPRHNPRLINDLQWPALRGFSD